MPLAFPSHQGLIAPLWRRWPRVFEVSALCVGAAMPDVIDGFVGAYRGYLGQGVGHSLAGLVLLCMPGGMLLWWMLGRLARRLPAQAHPGLLWRAWGAGVHAMRIAPLRDMTRSSWARRLGSLLIGACSHLVIDAVSHGDCSLLYPWRPDIHIFPEWWNVAWIRLPLPGYRKPYPIGPHFLVWAFLSVYGAWLLVKPLLHRPAGSRKGTDTSGQRLDAP